MKGGGVHGWVPYIYICMFMYIEIWHCVLFKGLYIHIHIPQLEHLHESRGAVHSSRHHGARPRLLG